MVMDHFLQPPLPSDDVDVPQPPSPLATMQMSNAYYNELDFDHGDGGTISRYEAISDEEEDEDDYSPTPKRLKTEPVCFETMSMLPALGNGYESPEEGEISDDPDVDADSEQTTSRISQNKGKSDKMLAESFTNSLMPHDEVSQFSSSKLAAFPMDSYLADVNIAEACDVQASGLDGADTAISSDDITKAGQAHHDNGSEFEIIDDLSSENGDENAGDGGLYSDESEVDIDVDEDEIEAMLEEGMPTNSEGKEKGVRKGKLSASGGAVDFQAPTMQDKVILVEKGQDPFDILPEGWLVVTHQSGMPIYLHKPTRVCTVSRPYFLGPGSARKHEIPLSAIPCLQYRRAMSKELAVDSKQTVTTSDSTLSLGGTSSNCLDTVTKQSKSSTEEQSADNGSTNENVTSTVSVSGDVAPTPEARALTVPTKVQSAEDHKKSNSLTPLEFRAYCQNLFEFKTITVRRFRRWKDRRKHNLLLKKASRPSLPPSTNLITCAIPTDKESHSSFRRKAFVLNPAGKSAVCILHEYAQHTMRIQPRYIFRELENSQKPYSATVVINDLQYGVGCATSKKMAKLEAAHNTLKILIPEIGNVKTDEQVEDLSYFDEIKIEDPRVVDLCNKAGHPTPYQILGECLKRNYGMGDTQVQMEINTVKHQKSEFIMRVGRHEAKVICKNKREGKQQAAQAILQMMHPHIRTWGSLLRLYAKASEIKDKREEEYSVTKLQTMAHPNKAILEKLRQEMTKLYHKHDAFQSNIKGKLKLTAPEMVSSELRAVDL